MYMSRSYLWYFGAYPGGLRYRKSTGARDGLSLPGGHGPSDSAGVKFVGQFVKTLPILALY